MMADFQSAGYRLLSFKYTPPLAVKAQAANDDKVGRKAKTSPENGSLSSLSSLLTSLQQIESSNDGGTKNNCCKEVCGQGKEGKQTGSQNSPEPLTQFHLFNDLPTEIRLKIWDLTFLPRVVEVRPPRPNYSRGQVTNT